MYTRFIENIIKNRILVVVFFILVAAGAFFSLYNAQVNAIPDIGENQQIIFSEWPGRSPVDVENFITYPLSTLVQGIPGVKDIRASSAFGFSIVYLIFDEEVDFYWSRSRVLEKLSTVGDILPEGVVPTLGPDATGLGQIFWYTLENSPDSTEPLSLAQLRSVQDFYVKYLLQTVEGVSEVASIGGFVKEYQIDIDPNQLMAFDISFASVLKAIRESNSDVGAEVIEEGDREIIVRGRGLFENYEDIETVVVAVKDGTPIRIKEIATVGTGPAFRRGALDRDGTEAVGGVVTMRFGENPREVINSLKELLPTIESGLPNGVELIPFYDRSEIISRSMNTVSTALITQIIITGLVILIFLMHFRSSFLVTLTLPFGVGISFIFMYLLDIESNIMSLSGLVISIGAMVDMGIIITESIYAKLADNPQAGPKDRLKLIVEASSEVGPAVLTAVMTTIVTFLPVFGLEGAEGKLFGPLAWAKTLAMFGAVTVAIVLIPVLAVFLLRGELKPLQESRFGSGLIRIYEPSLSWVLENRGKFLLIPISLLLLGALAFTRLGSEFMPDINEGDIMYMPMTTPEVSITKARELLSYTNKIINQHPLVESSIGKLGRAQSALDPAPVAMIETVVRLVDESQWPKGTSVYDIISDLDESLQVPGLVNSWSFPIQIRVAMLATGIRTPVGIKIFGPDLEVLESLAQDISREVEKVEGAYGVVAEQIGAKTYLEFTVDRVAASRYGINAGTINQILQTAVGGMKIGDFFDGRERYPIRVRYKKELRDRIDELKKVLVPSPLGQHIPLDQLADIKMVTGPAMINSENGLLRSTVMLNVRDRDLIGFVEEASRHIDENVTLPPGYTISWAGQYHDMIRASQRLMVLIPLALLINYFLIFFGLGKKWRNGAIVFSAIPISFAGGLLLLWFGGFNTSVAVWVGFIALFGIAVDDGVVMMTYLQQEVKRLRPTNWEELKVCVIEAGCRRIRPLVMTSITTIIALIPVMWATGIGSEIMKPMAIPTIGGLLVATISVFMVPIIFSHFELKKIQDKEI